MVQTKFMLMIRLNCKWSMTIKSQLSTPDIWMPGSSACKSMIHVVGVVNPPNVLTKPFAQCLHSRNCRRMEGHFNLSIFSTILLHRMRRVSACENLTIALHCKMNDIAEMKTAHASCECVEIPPARTHDDNDIQTAATWNIASSNLGKNQVSELLSSDVMHAHHSVCHSAQELCWELDL